MIAKNLEDIFPFLNKAEAHQAAYYAKKKSAKAVFSYKGQQCSDKELSLYYLDDRLKEYVVRLYEDSLMGKTTNFGYSGNIRKSYRSQQTWFSTVCATKKGMKRLPDGQKKS